VKDGQIEIRGETLFSGYFGQPEWPAQAWFPTGDLGRLDESGRLQVVGRTADRIVSGGENVDPVEVENTLSPGSERRLCVVGRAHAEWGEQVVLLIEGGYDEALVQQLIRRARSHLAPFKRPRAYAFVEQFPLGPTGKIQRRLLQEQAVELAPLSYAMASP
jgi:acyl-CoA synthetase (AMP-forming)/AMP-acid ligase II